jgi:hypothetical protein
MSGIAITANGFTVDAEVIAAGFTLDPAQVPGLLRKGRITSRCETGIDADAGRFRLTFYHAERALRLIVDSQGTILQRSRFPVAAQSRLTLQDRRER